MVDRMYAVVKTGGKQYKVALGDRLRVDRLHHEAGACVHLNEVLMVADGEAVDLGTPTLDTSVMATVLSHGREGKIKVFKMRRRKHYRKTQGHRQDFTLLKITAIGDHRLPDQTVEDQAMTETGGENGLVATETETASVESTASRHEAVGADETAPDRLAEEGAEKPSTDEAGTTH